MNKIYIETFNYITICYVKMVESVKLMVQEHYDTPEYENTMFFINVFPTDTVFDGVLDKLFKRRIYYMLEHKLTDEHYYSCPCYEWDNYYMELLRKANITEMWTMDYKPQFAVRCAQEFGIPIKYVPVRYTRLIKPVENIYTTPKTVDLCLIGSIYDKHRSEIIQELINTRTCSIKMLVNRYNENMSYVINEMNSSRFILDTLRDKEMLTPNQVRIFELLCMGYTVLSEKSQLNMFPGLIYEWDTVDDLYKISKAGQYLYPTEKYKEMTYTDEAYEKYVNNLIKQQS